MNEKLRNYIESLFEDAPKSKQAVELKEEILQNTIDKYNDLLAEGKGEEASFNIAVAGIGDVSELLNNLRAADYAANQYTKAEIEASKKRSALFVSVAVMLYILCIIPCIIFNSSYIGPVLMFMMIALATGLIIYNSKTRIQYNKRDDTIVENFKEWNTEKNERGSLRKSINSSIWALTLALYFIISFTTGAWYITWVIFLISGAIENIIKACFELKK